MREGTAADVLKVWLCAAATILLGAWMAPLVYNAGKALADVASSKTTNGPLEWLADVCRVAPFPRFFEASVFLAAALLFLPFFEWLGGRKPGGQPLGGNTHRARQAVLGFLAAAGMCAVIALVLRFAGVYRWQLPKPGMFGEILRIFAVALILAALWEIVFRGIALGVFLRAMPVWAAIGLSAVLFAAIRFLHPLADVNVADPDAARVGFELLRKIVAQLADPRRIAGAFLPPLALGCVLAWARWRTASLALPWGFHAGWIFGTMLLGRLALSQNQPTYPIWLLSAPSLAQGLAPLAGILVAGILIVHLNRPRNADAA